MQSRSFVKPGLILLLGLLISWGVLAATIDRVFANRAPALALQWNPASADANARLGDTLLQGGDIKANAARIAALADRSIRRQPINPVAARLLGLVAAARGDEGRATGLVHYAEAMSRRDLPTQLWLIETNVARGDVDAALRHYNRALKTSVSGRTLLFPILAQAANDRAIWVPLSRMLAERPQWWRPFMVQAVQQGNNPDALYAFARRLGIDQPGRLDTGLLQGIEKRLVDLGDYRRSAELFNRAHGQPVGSNPLLRNGGFEQPSGFDPFEWNLKDEPDLAAVRQPSPRAQGGSALFLTATNGRGGDLAVQLIMLAPGRYAVGATVGGVSGDPLAFPHLVVRCAKDGREIVNTPFPAAPNDGRAWRTGFTVPADCAAQRIVFQATASLDPSDLTPWIDNITIQPQEGR